MLPVGGNSVVTIEKKSAKEFNVIGERKVEWTVDRTLTGSMDYQGGGASRVDYGTKLEDTTHIFLCDFVDLGPKAELTHRLIFKGEIYEILQVDNPMELDYHLEIYLKYTGA